MRDAQANSRTQLSPEPANTAWESGRLGEGTPVQEGPGWWVGQGPRRTAVFPASWPTSCLLVSLPVHEPLGPGKHHKEDG